MATKKKDEICHTKKKKKQKKNKKKTAGLRKKNKILETNCLKTFLDETKAWRLPDKSICNFKELKYLGSFKKNKILNLPRN